MFLKQDIESRQTGWSTTEWLNQWLCIRQRKTLWQPCVTAQIFKIECWVKEVRIYTMCFHLHKVKKLAKQTDGVKVRTLCVSRWVHSGRNHHAVHTSIRIRLKRPHCFSLVVFPLKSPASRRTAALTAAQDKIREAMAPRSLLSCLTQSSADLLAISPLPPARCPSGLLLGLSSAHPPSLNSVLHKGSHSNRV